MDDSLVMRCSEDVEHGIGNREDASGKEPSPVARPLIERLSVEQIHDEKNLTIVRHVVVDDGHGSGMLDAVGEVSLVDETLPHLGARRELGCSTFRATCLPLR